MSLRERSRSCLFILHRVHGLSPLCMDYFFVHGLSPFSNNFMITFWQNCTCLRASACRCIKMGPLNHLDFLQFEFFLCCITVSV